jgi:hypothetical protein
MLMFDGSSATTPCYDDSLGLDGVGTAIRSDAWLVVATSSAVLWIPESTSLHSFQSAKIQNLVIFELCLS